jgi:D-glycerate 3-kinase
MNKINICFDRVKKDCFKFIKSQETVTEKFRNKDGMLKTFLIPMCFWIANKTNIKNLILLVWLEDKALVKQLLVQLLK